MTRTCLTSDLPWLFKLDAALGLLHSVHNPQADIATTRDLINLARPCERQALQDLLASLQTDPPPRFMMQLHLALPSGGFTPVTFFGTATQTPHHFICAVSDITGDAGLLDRYRMATAASNDVLFLLDFDSDQHWWSDSFTRIFGHPPINTPDVIERWFDLVHPEDLARIRASHSRARASRETTWKDEYRFRRADGTYAYVSDRAQFFRRPDGSIARSISSMTDITEQHEVAELFRQTAEASRDVIYSQDEVSRTLWLSDAFRTRYGLDPAIHANDPESFVQLIHPADRPGFQLMWTHSLQSSTDDFELSYRLRKGDGTYASVIERARVVRDGEGRAIRIVGSLVDVTHLRQEEERLRAVVEVAANVVYEFDVASMTFFYSEGMEKTFGHEGLSPQSPMNLWEDLLHPEDKTRVPGEFLRFILGTERYAKLEYRFARADGSYARVRERMIALREEDGSASRVIGGIEDITGEYETQERLRQSQKLEAIGKLTGGVAHDFNNLLTVIIGSAGLLEAAINLDADLRDLARNITFAARRGAELTSGLLSFARQQPLAPRTLDMSAIFAEMESLLRRTLPADITLTTVLTPELWAVEADPTQLNAALLNLCVNAADAMPEGGSISLESRNWVIDAGYSQIYPEARPGEFLRIDIKDTGQGMTQDVVSRAFDPFFTTKPLGKGSGLGLSMVWGFAKQSGGHANIQSEPGVGTTVSMFLPRSRKGVAPVAEAAPRAPSYGMGQHVLVVEDDPMLRRFVAALVERLGYRVAQAENGDQALELLHAHADIELLFSDVVMPGNMSGRELAEKALQDRPDLLVLFTSGYSEDAIIHNGRLDEEVHFLAKPYQLRDLGEKLREVFATKPNPLRSRLSAAPLTRS